MSGFLMGVSNNLQEEYHSAMLHDNLNISCLMVHAKHMEDARLGGRVRMLRGQDLLIEVLQKICLRYKTSLGL